VIFTAHDLQNRYLVGFKYVCRLNFIKGMIGNHIARSLCFLFFFKKSDRLESYKKNRPDLLKKYHMIKKLLLLLFIVFVNPIFAQIKQLGIKQRGDATTAFTKETELTIENLMALKPDHDSYHCAKESDDSDPVSMGWTVAGADLEEGKGRIRMVKVSFCFVK
jgi:hypothetical protein